MHDTPFSPSEVEGRARVQLGPRLRSDRTVVLVALLFSACAGIDGPDAGTDAGVVIWPAGTLELGAEASGAFSTFPAQVQATPGAQGGYHVAVMYRVTGKALPGVLFEHRVTRARDGTLVSKGNRTMSVDPVAAGQSWVSPGAVIIFICPTPVGVSVLGEELNFEITASKGGEILGKVSARAGFGCPSGDSFCASICSG